MTNWASSATAVRGARRILTECRRNNDYAQNAGLPAWLRAVCAGRVQDAENRLRELERAAA